MSLRQPFAWLVVNGHKDVENRPWRTAYRGPLLIHAGLKWPTGEQMEAIEAKYGLTIPDSEMVFGGIVGRVELVDCVTTHPSHFSTAVYTQKRPRLRARSKYGPPASAASRPLPLPTLARPYPFNSLRSDTDSLLMSILTLRLPSWTNTPESPCKLLTGGQPPNWQESTGIAQYASFETIRKPLAPLIDKGTHRTANGFPTLGIICQSTASLRP